jgi:hypothetical protein
MFLYDLLKDPALLPSEDAIDLPDFVRPDYPFDLPPYRRAFFARVFEAAGVPRTCPNGACRRARRCQGEAGPPCYRADRERLSRLLLRVYVALHYMTPEGIAAVAIDLDEELGGPPLNLTPDFLRPLAPPMGDDGSR